MLHYIRSVKLGKEIRAFYNRLGWREEISACRKFTYQLLFYTALLVKYSVLVHCNPWWPPMECTTYHRNLYALLCFCLGFLKHDLLQSMMACSCKLLVVVIFYCWHLGCQIKVEFLYCDLWKELLTWWLCRDREKIYVPTVACIHISIGWSLQICGVCYEEMSKWNVCRDKVRWRTGPSAQKWWSLQLF